MAKKSSKKIINQLKWKIPELVKIIPDDDPCHSAKDEIEYNGKDVLLNGKPLIQYDRQTILKITGYITKKYKQCSKTSLEDK